MCIITVSRGSFLGASKVASEIARDMEIPCLEREVLLRHAEEFGLSEEELSEDDYRPPLIFERLTKEKESRLAALRATLLQKAVLGALVYHGYGGHLLLAGTPTLLRLRIVAPFELRVGAVQREQGLGLKAAEKHVLDLDRQRSDWTRFLYGVDWHDPSLYDLVINLEFVTLSEASSMVRELARSQRYRRTPEDQQRIEDLSLASRVQAELGITRSSRLEIVAESGTVEIRGITFFREHREELEAAARKVDGVEEVCIKLASSMERLGL